MKLGVKQFLGDGHQSCGQLMGILDLLGACLESALPELRIKGSSNRVRAALKAALDKSGDQWHSNLVLPLETDVRPGPYKIDWVRNVNLCDCGKSHRIFIDVAFDNAQVVMSNLLKLTRASADYLASAKTPATTLTVIITIEKGSAGALGWDNSVGTRQEYDFAFRTFFGAGNFSKPSFLSFSAIS